MNKKFLFVFFLIFLISGFSGLIYESIWTHYLKLFLGHAAYAQSLVLIIFMGGMAIGSYVSSVYMNRWKNLFLGYALVEGVIGVLALVFHEGFTAFLEISYTSILGSLDTATSVSLYKWISAGLLILPQSILLGTTFPLMSAAVLRAFPKLPGKNISLLYFTNSFGAAIGVLVSGFYLIKLFGLPGTIQIAGIINIVIAASVFVLIKKYKFNFLKRQDEHSLKNNKAPGSNKLKYVLLSVAVFTGMASFIYEIAWIRMLNLVLGTSTHAFELMLSAFIFGLAFGGLWINNRIDRIANPIRYLAFVQFIMGAMAVLTLFLYNYSFDAMQWVLQTVPKNDEGYFWFNLASNGIAFMIMLPATFCAGMTLPLITTILFRTYGERSIGEVYAWNTIGAIVGVLFAVHLGITLFGLKGLINFGASLDMALGLILLLTLDVSKSHVDRIKLIGILAGMLLVSSMVFIQFNTFKMASGIYRESGLMTSESNKILFYEDGKTATVSTILHEGLDVVSIRTNGKTDASLNAVKKEVGNIDESTMIQIAAISMALHPAAKNVANIGLGSGLTTKTILDNPHIQNVHTVEIEAQMVEAAKHFGQVVAPVFSDSRSKIIIDDAKSFFTSNRTKYDIILSEPSNPWVSGVAGLYSREFYALIKRQLNQGGVFAQWIQLYNIDLELVVSILKAVSLIFPDYEVYILNGSDCLVVAKKDGLLPPLRPKIFSCPVLAYELSRIDVKSVQDFQFRLLGNKKILDPFLNSFSITANSDYYPVLDQNAAKTRFLRKNANELYGFKNMYHPVISLIREDVPQWEKTNIVPNSFYKRTRRANEAMALRDFYLYGNFDLNYPSLPDNLRNEALHLKRLLTTKSKGRNGSSRIPFLYNASVRMTPFLTSFEMVKVWDSMGGVKNPNLGGLEKVWMALFQAEAKRDAETMVSKGEYLLKNNFGLHPQHKEYLISSVILGYIMQEKFDKAQFVWRTYQGYLSDNLQSKDLFRFLAAQCINS